MVPVYLPAKSFSNALGPISEMPRQKSVASELTTPAAPIAINRNANADKSGLSSADQSTTFLSETPLGPISERPSVVSESDAPAQRLVIGNAAIANIDASRNDLHLRGTTPVGVNATTPKVDSQLSTQPRNAPSVQPDGVANSSAVVIPRQNRHSHQQRRRSRPSTRIRMLSIMPPRLPKWACYTPEVRHQTRQQLHLLLAQLLQQLPLQARWQDSSAVAIGSLSRSNDAPNENNSTTIGSTPPGSSQPAPRESLQSSQQVGPPLDQTTSLISTLQGGAETTTVTAKKPDVISTGESSPLGPLSTGSVSALGPTAASSENELIGQSIDKAFQGVQSEKTTVHLPASESTLPTIVAQDAPPPPHIDAAAASTPIILFAIPIFALLLLTYVGLRCA